MKIIPPFLKKGDTIGIVAPARSISIEQMQLAIDFVQNAGFKIKFIDGLFEIEHQFAGTEKHRAEVFNRALKDSEIKAIWCARGGYGTARMIDLIDFNLLIQNPKWIAGFSDITILLNHISKNCNMAALHSTMPIFMNDKSGADYQEVANGLVSFLAALQGQFDTFDLNLNDKIRNQSFEGEILGGNLSVLLSALGSDSDEDWSNKILFIEDLDEYFYHIDRMFLTLKRANKINNLKALLVGSFIQMKDHNIPFGYNVKDIITQHTKNYDYPVIFDLNVGHHLNNLTLPFGIFAKYQNGFLTFASV